MSPLTVTPPLPMARSSRMSCRSSLIVVLVLLRCRVEPDGMF